MTRFKTFTAPLGSTVDNWIAPPWPAREAMVGRYCKLEPLNAEKHAARLYHAFEGHDHVWDYLPYGPFSSSSQYHRWIKDVSKLDDTVFYAIENLESGRFEGVASYLRIRPETGSIEVGHINMSPALQRTKAATEAMFLMMQWAFNAGYRRYEWKCNALNLASRRAAQRYGFSYEGVFRKAAIVKGRNRDTAWFAAIDNEWPGLKEAFEAWLSASNFDSTGHQKERLSDLTGLVRYSTDPALESAT